MILRRTGEAHSRTCKWVAATLGASVSLQNVRTQSGKLVELLSQRAAALDCELIVLSPSLVDVGGVATSLARSAKVPVLVVRGHVENGSVFAATDLQDPGFPVLRCGSLLAQEFGARLVTFHNVDPLPAVNATAFGVVPGVPAQSVLSPTQRGNYLAEASRQLPTPAIPVLRSNVDSVQSILTEAKIRDADVVVVGTHYRPWWERILTGSVASCVTARADRSVMVMPLADAPTSSP
jgi:nucleotide-binding universal stress UspA family protein